MRPRSVLPVLGIAVIAPLFAGAQPIGTAFTYQGQLMDAGSPANGPYDLRLLLYDAVVGGSQVGPIVTRDDVAVNGGLFTVALDFGAVFGGAKRFLEIGVRPGASGGAYTIVVPRQELTPPPGSLFASTAANSAGNAFRIETSSNAQNAVLELKDNSPGQAQVGAVNFLQAGDTVRGRIAYQNPDGPMTFRVAGANGLTLSATGLDVNAAQVTFGSANGAIAYVSPNGPMNFTVGGANQMRLSSTGLDIAGGQVTFGSVEGWKDAGTDLIGTVGALTSVAIARTIGTGSSTADFDYNHFGSGGTPNSGNMTNSSDVYIADDLEVDGVTSVATLEVDGTASKTTAGGWLANSDRRLKTDIEGLEDALDVVRRLHPVRFHYNEEFLRKHPSVKDVYYHNYIAQEFQDVFPDSVQDDGEGFLQIETYPAGIYAVAAIQELDRLVAEKDARISALEERIARLEKAVNP